MVTIEDFPLEVLDKIFSILNGNSVITASNVCLSWRKVIHKSTNLSASKCSPDLQEKMQKCGWILEDHDIENCKCIELNTYLFKFIDNKALPSCELIKERTVNDKNCFSVLNSKLFISNKGAPLGDDISIIDLSQPCSQRTDLFKQGVYTRTEEMRRKLFSVIEFVTLIHSHHKTLVTAIDEFYDSSLEHEYLEWLQGKTFDYELDSDEPEYRGKEYYRGSRIIVWNHETLHHVSDVNVLEKLNEFTFYESTGNDFDVVHFAMANGKLAVNIEVIYENSPRLKQGLTQIWKLDTEDPSTENIHYLTTINHGWRGDERFIFDMFMNSKLLGIVLQNPDEETLLSLSVYLHDDPSFHTTSVIQEIEDFGDVDIILDTEFSNKIAVLHKRRNLLKVYKFDGSNIGIHLEIDLSRIVVKESDVLLIANYMVGKIMIINESDGQFQNIIVTEDGEVVEGNKQMFQEGEVKIIEATFCAEGIVVKAEEKETRDWLFGCSIVSYYHN